MRAWTSNGYRLRGYSQVFCAAAVALASVTMAGAASAAKAPTSAPTAGDTWPVFGHDALHSGISSDTAIGASTAPGLTKRWSQPLGSSSDQASPAVAYNTTLKKTLVYYVTYPGVAYAFNASTGALIWRQKVGPDVFSSPAVSGNTVYFGDNEGALEALNAATGAVQCTFTIPTVSPNKKPGRIFSSPVVGTVDSSGPVVFFGDAGLASSTEATNGGHMWAITGVGNTAGNCKEKWSYNDWPNKGGNGTMTGVWDEPALVKNSNGTWAVVFGTSNPDGAVYALNAATGSLLWRFQTLQNGQDADVGAGPTIGAPGANGFPDGVVYIDGKDGVEYALNLLTGKQIWSFTLGAGTGSAFGVSTAALTGNTLVACYAASVFALNATTGAQIWKTTPGGTIHASPAVSGGTGNQVLFLGDLSGHEFGLTLTGGTKVFSATPGSQIQASAAVADGMLYFAANGTLYAYAPK